MTYVNDHEHGLRNTLECILKTIGLNRKN